MATHRFVATTWHNVLGTLPAELRIESGDTVVTDTIDAHGKDRDNVRRANSPNPMNGPIHVAGAEPGDALRVDILKMKPIRDTGWTGSTLAANVVDPGFADELPPRKIVTWQIDRKAKTVRLDRNIAGLEHLVLPLAPMIGCFGVAPSGGQALSTATSAENGGNMDYRLFGPGTSVSFPVSAPGALFFLGDCHAVPGRRRDRRHRRRDRLRGEVRLTVEKGPADHLAARRDADRHLHRRQRPPARPGAPARDDRDGPLARRGFRPRPRPPRAT